MFWKLWRGLDQVYKLCEMAIDVLSQNKARAIRGNHVWLSQWQRLSRINRIFRLSYPNLRSPKFYRATGIASPLEPFCVNNNYCINLEFIFDVIKIFHRVTKFITFITIEQKSLRNFKTGSPRSPKLPKAKPNIKLQNAKPKTFVPDIGRSSFVKSYVNPEVTNIQWVLMHEHSLKWL